MPFLKRHSTLLISAVLLPCLAGCTLYPEKKPTVGTTTSAEATQRFFWNDVAAGKWVEANALVAPDVVVRLGTRVLNHQQFVEWLKGLQVKSAAMGDTQIKASVNDMMLLYTLQLTGNPAFVACEAASSSGAAGMQTLSALAVWQAPQPDPQASKKQKQAAPAYLMTVLDLTPQAGGSAAAGVAGSCGAGTGF